MEYQFQPEGWRMSYVLPPLEIGEANTLYRGEEDHRLWWDLTIADFSVTLERTDRDSALYWRELQRVWSTHSTSEDG